MVLSEVAVFIRDDRLTNDPDVRTGSTSCQHLIIMWPSVNDERSTIYGKPD